MPMNDLDPKYIWQYFFNTLLGWVILALAIVFFLRPVLTVFGGAVKDLASNESATSQINSDLEKNLNYELNQTLSSSTQWVVYILVLLIVLIIDWVWAKITYKNFHYQMSEEGFKKEW